jgi:hypothetical protein
MEAATATRPQTEPEAPAEKPAVPPEQLALPKIDGQSVDRIEIKFSGSIRLDRSDPADVALYRRFMLGKEVDLRIVGTAAGKDHKISYDEDCYPGEVTGIAKLKLTSVFRPLGDGSMARTGSNQTELTDEAE